METFEMTMQGAAEHVAALQSRLEGDGFCLKNSTELLELVMEFGSSFIELDIVEDEVIDPMFVVINFTNEDGLWDTYVVPDPSGQVMPL